MDRAIAENDRQRAERGFFGSYYVSPVTIATRSWVTLYGELPAWENKGNQ